jgi:hypothetical protein
MLRKITMALAVAAIVGGASVAQANDNDRNDRGGFRYGPYGQRMGGTGFRPHWRGHTGAYFGLAYAPRHRRVWYHY